MHTNSEITLKQNESLSALCASLNRILKLQLNLIFWMRWSGCRKSQSCPPVESEGMQRLKNNSEWFRQVMVHTGVLWSLCYVNTDWVKLFMFLYSGNTGTELSSTNLGMFITSDAGNSWRQVGQHAACIYLKSIMHPYWKRAVLSGGNWFCLMCTNTDFWWRAQRLVSWQRRGFAGRLTRGDAYSALMVGVATVQQ